MGLFGKLFDKKICDICGGEIGLLGNRKLADGNLCKNCAALLSPWMTDRRQSTVDEIRRHIVYRKANQGVVPLVEPTRVFGHDTRVFIDDNKRLFLVTPFSDWQRRNPDVMRFDQVTDCAVSVREHREELFDRAPDGRRVPFDPRRFDFTYEFRVHMTIDSPFFDEIDFELSDERPHGRMTPEYRALEIEANKLQNALRPDIYPIVIFPPLPVPPRPAAPIRPGAEMGPMRPAPVQPGPVRPGSAGNGPVRPEPVRPEPVRPEPVRPAPAPEPPRGPSVRPAAPSGISPAPEAPRGPAARPVPPQGAQNAAPSYGPRSVTQPGPVQPQGRPQQPAPPQQPKAPQQPQAPQNRPASPQGPRPVSPSPNGRPGPDAGQEPEVRRPDPRRPGGGYGE